MLHELIASRTMEDMPILEARLLGPRDKAISRVSELSHWLVELPQARLNALGLDGADALRQRLEAARALDPHVQRKGKHGARRLRIADGLMDLRVEPLEEAPEEAGFEKQGLGLSLWTDLMGATVLRPDEIVQALLGEDAADCRVVRLGVCVKGPHRWTPMQLDELREQRSVAEVRAP